MEKQKEKPKERSGILFNPYLDRSRASSKGSVRDRSAVGIDDLSDDSEENKDASHHVKSKKKSLVDVGAPLAKKEDSMSNSGFFSNTKHLLELKRSIQKNAIRGSTPVRQTVAPEQKQPTETSTSFVNSNKKKLNSKTNTSIADVKISFKDFMNSIETQKKINTSKLIARKFSSPFQDLPQSNTFTVSNTKVEISKDRPFNPASFSLGFKINKNELTSMAQDMSSKLVSLSEHRKIDSYGILAQQSKVNDEDGA